MKKLFKYLLLSSLISLSADAVIFNDNMQDVAPTLILNTEGGVIFSDLNYYLNQFTNKSDNQSFILPIIILDQGVHYAFNSHCLRLSSQHLIESVQYDNGMNYLNMNLEFLKEEEKFIPNFVSICKFDNSILAKLFLDNLPKRDNLQLVSYTLYDKKTSKVKSAISINNSNKDYPIMYLTNK